MTTAEPSSAIPLPDLNTTQMLAASLAKSLTPGLIIYLTGELGAGKTTLVRAMLTALGHTGITKSPTYTLVETYDLHGLTIHHFDLYRLADPSELEFIGIRDYVAAKAICIFEWPHKGHGYVPKADLEITLKLEHNNRTATITAKSPLGAKILQAVSLGCK